MKLFTDMYAVREYFFSAGEINAGQAPAIGWSEGL